MILPRRSFEKSASGEIATTTSGYRLSLTLQMRLATIALLCCAHRRLLGCCSFRSWVSPSRSDATTARQAAAEAHRAAKPARRAEAACRAWAVPRGGVAPPELAARWAAPRALAARWAAPRALAARTAAPQGLAAPTGALPEPAVRTAV